MNKGGMKEMKIVASIIFALMMFLLVFGTYACLTAKI